MILDEVFRINTCQHDKAIKSKQSFTYKGLPVYLCKKCEKIQSKENIK